MSKESLKDFNFYNNIYTAVKEGDSLFQDDTTNSLLDYYRMFLERYPDTASDPNEYLGNDEEYMKFKSNFMLMYKHHAFMPNARYAVPLFVYLYDSNPLGYNSEKFDSFVNKSYGINFNELLSIYDVYNVDMDLETIEGRSRG